MTEIIGAEIDKRFAEQDRVTVRALLADCRDDRVRLSILRLSRGKISRVEDLVKAAKRDYRDVIAWASQPTRRYIAGLLCKGPQWSPEDENGRTNLNRETLRSWKDAGAIVVGGWFVESIRSGKLMFEFHPWLSPDGLKIASPDEL